MAGHTFPCSPQGGEISHQTILGGVYINKSSLHLYIWYVYKNYRKMPTYADYFILSLQPKRTYTQV